MLAFAEAMRADAAITDVATLALVVGLGPQMAVLALDEL